MYGVRMPFGKHKGCRLDDIDTGYLTWVLKNCDNLQPWLLTAVVQELRSRGITLEVADDECCPVCRRTPEAQRPMPAPGPSVNVRNVLDSWFRQQALQHHPDRGGSHAVMTALNEARERLLDALQ